jgi:predicted unusual protein kinase regulating ubiquinone biosynthesis (AarF/ABC1/UbiB family)
MDQIFEKVFFHADPHPGNLFVIPPQDPEGKDWQLAFVDFGMVGHVPGSALDGLREMVIAVGTRDPGRLVRAYEKLGFFLPGADLELIEKAEAKAFERFWGMNMSELQEIDHKELMDFAHEFRDLMYEMPFQIPQDLLLLGRTMAILSGMCTGLDQNFNLWENIQPYAEKLVKAEISGNREMWWGEIEGFLRLFANLPRRLDGMLSRVERGALQVQVPELGIQLVKINKSVQSLTGAVIFAALLIGGLQLLLAGISLPGYILLGISLIPFLVLLLRK